MIINTIKSIVINRDILSIATFPYSILGLKKILGKEFHLPRKDVQVKECDYPIKDKQNINEIVFCINGKEDDCQYFIQQFFSESLKDFID